jgi:hypothetical protein
MFQERRIAAIVRSTYKVVRGTQVIFLCRRNLAVDILWPIFCDCNTIQGSGVFLAESFCESLHFIMMSLMYYATERRSSLWCFAPILLASDTGNLLCRATCILSLRRCHVGYNETR